MDYVANSETEVQAMLAAIGVQSIDQLFADVPKNLKVKRPTVDDGMSEYDGMLHIEALAAQNTFPDYTSYMGMGAYEHHIPAMVGPITQKSEFLTAYTPYQAEASQGTLQAIFEFQTAVAALTGLDVANASVYDGANACAEAVLMALRHHKDRRRIVVSDTLHPHYRKVVDQYVACMVGAGELQLDTFAANADGSTNFAAPIDAHTAAILIQSPNVFGVLEEISEVIAKAKEVGALVVLCSNPMAYGLFASAGELEADIAVGDMQPFGVPLQFGGPYVGYMACKQALVRQMPGRIVGATTDADGRHGYVLTLQAREQHIRREKANSSICSKQNLAALASLITVLWYGPEGIKKLALTNYQRTAYLRDTLSQIRGVTIVSSLSHFNEFIVKFDAPTAKVENGFLDRKIIPGIHLGRFYPDREGEFLIAVTETKSRSMLDQFASVAREVLG